MNKMETKELRIGNILTDGKFLFIVESIEAEAVWGDIYECIKAERIEDYYDEGVYHLNIENIKGIPLTEDWLVKFGFEKKSNQRKSWYLSDSILIKNGWAQRAFYIYKEKKIMSVRKGYPTSHVKYIFYVHQLQNLYFALTGEELTIK